MNRIYSSIALVAFNLLFATQLHADDTKATPIDSKSVPDKIAVAAESALKMDKAMNKDAPVLFQKSTYNDFMNNVAWMNRNGFVVGAPAWKGGEDGLHCH
jgi:hypothetical protein